MTRRERTGAWLIILGLLLIAVWGLRDVLLPFVAAMAIAYFLDPLVDRTERLGLPRAGGTILVLAVFAIVCVTILLLLVPVVSAQVLRLAEVVPGYLARLENLIGPYIDQIEAKARLIGFSEVQEVAKAVFSWLVSALKRIVQGGLAVANIVSILLITPIVAFYLLRDWDRMIATVDDWLPRAQAPEIRGQMREIDRTLSAFVRGQGTVCLVLGGFYAIGLSLAGLDFGIVIGLFAGLVSFIPFVGSILGGLLSIGLALVQFGDWPPVLVVAAIFVVGQVVEGNFLTPTLVGDAVGLHPVWVILALLAGGSLFGFLGVLIAVPMAAVIGVLSRYALERYLDSPLHTEGIPPPDDELERQERHGGEARERDDA